MKLFTLILVILIVASCSTTPGDSPDNAVVPEVPTTPETPSESIRVCVIGDGGTGEIEQYDIAKALMSEECSVVLYVGDVVYEKGITDVDDKDFFEKFYNPYRKMLEKNIPFYMSMGNHDWYWTGSGKHWVKLDEKYEAIKYPWYAYAVNLGQGLCITQFEIYKKSYHDDILEWHEKVKKDGFYSHCKFNLGFGHYPYWSPGMHGDIEGHRKEYLEEMGVGELFNLYISGHDHFLADEGTYKKTRLLISGSAGKLRGLEEDARKWGLASRGYLVVDYKNEKASFYFVSVDGHKKQVVHSDQI